MVQYCCVTGCSNVWKRNSNIAYHTFPVRNQKRLAQWMQVEELKSINVTAGKRICSVHFTPESFEEHCAVKRLKKNAVPSLFGEAVQIIDDSPVEIIEIWEEICTDGIPEETKTVSDEVFETEQVTQEKVQEVEVDTEGISQSSVEEHDLPVENVVETKDASVQTISAYYEYREEIWELRKKLSMLRQQLKQREASISSTREYINLLTSSKTPEKTAD